MENLFAWILSYLGLGYQPEMEVFEARKRGLWRRHLNFANTLVISVSGRRIREVRTVEDGAHPFLVALGEKSGHLKPLRVRYFR